MGCNGSTSPAAEARGEHEGPHHRARNPLAGRQVAPDVARRRDSTAGRMPRTTLPGGGSDAEASDRSMRSDLVLEEGDALQAFHGVSSAIAMVTSRRSSRSSIDSESDPGMSQEADSSQSQPTELTSSFRSVGSGSSTELLLRSRQSSRIGSLSGVDVGDSVRIVHSGRTFGRGRMRRQDSVEALQDESDGDADEPSDGARQCRLAGDVWDSELECAIPSADDRYAQLRLDQEMFADSTLNAAGELAEGGGLLWEHPELQEGLPCPLRFFPLLGSADDALTRGGFGCNSPWSTPSRCPRPKTMTFDQALRAYLDEEAGTCTRLGYFLRRTAEQVVQIRAEFRLDRYHTAHRLSESLRNLTESFPHWHRLRAVVNELTMAVSHYELLQVAGVQRLIAEMISRGDDLAIPLCVWNRRQLPAEETLREFCRNRVEYALNVLASTVKFVQASVPPSS